MGRKLGSKDMLWGGVGIEVEIIGTKKRKYKHYNGSFAEVVKSSTKYTLWSGEKKKNLCAQPVESQFVVRDGEVWGCVW